MHSPEQVIISLTEIMFFSITCFLHCGTITSLPAREINAS